MSGCACTKPASRWCAARSRSGEQRRGRVVERERVELRVVRGRHHDHVVRAGNAGSCRRSGTGSARRAPASPACRARPAPTRVRPRAASSPRARTERARIGRRGGRRAGGRPAAVEHSGGSARAGRDDHARPGQLVGTQLLHVVRLGGWRRVAWSRARTFRDHRWRTRRKHRGDGRRVARRGGHADRARRDRRRRAPLGLHPEQGDGRHRQRARRPRRARTRWVSTPTAVSTCPRCARASAAWKRRCAPASPACSSRRACASCAAPAGS